MSSLGGRCSSRGCSIGHMHPRTRFLSRPVAHGPESRRDLRPVLSVDSMRRPLAGRRILCAVVRRIAHRCAPYEDDLFDHGALLLDCDELQLLQVLPTWECVDSMCVRLQPPSLRDDRWYIVVRSAALKLSRFLLRLLRLHVEDDQVEDGVGALFMSFDRLMRYLFYSRCPRLERVCELLPIDACDMTYHHLAALIDSCHRLRPR